MNTQRNKDVMVAKCRGVVINWGHGALFPLILLLGGYHSAAHAVLYVRDESPFALLVGIPEMHEAVKLPAGAQRFSLVQTMSNNWQVERDQQEALWVDGETDATNLSWQYGFQSVELMITVPYLIIREGNMDSLVEGFHRSFSMPNGGREYYKKDQLFFAYEREDGSQSLRLTERQEGVGDIRIGLDWQISRAAGDAHSAGLQLKLANGNVNDWLGSDSYDLAFTDTHQWDWASWRTNLQCALLLMQDAGFMEGLRQPIAGVLNAALSYKFLTRGRITMQYDAHSSLFKDSSMAQLSGAQQMSFGVEWRAPRWGWHAAILENLSPERAPDVGFQLGLEFKMR